MSSYYNRPIVLHLEVLSQGEWFEVLDSQRGSVEAVLALGRQESSDTAWRVVDAGGNVHQTSEPGGQDARDNRLGSRTHLWPRPSTTRPTLKGRVHITEGERRRLLEESLNG
jgi:hypothetical protein